MSTADNNTSQSSSSLNNNNNNNNRDDENRDVKQQSDHYLKQLNRASHKISKPIRRPPPPPLEHHHQQQQQQQQDPQQQQQQHQPPVYNINKSDFRDVVQKLTGSPLSSPPSSSSSSSSPQIHPSKGPKPPNSRLHRIRPPPLPNLPTNTTPGSANPVGVGGPPPPPFSPLPPLPSVHTAAESPITAYMRCLRGSTTAFSPRWGIGNPELNQQQSNQLILPLPSSPFGGIGGVVSPSLVFSPSSQLAPPMSPSWRSL